MAACPPTRRRAPTSRRCSSARRPTLAIRGRAAKDETRGPGEGGFALVLLLAAISVMMILMGGGVSSWKYVMQDDREQELYFRGDQIARAIEEYQRKNGNALPPSFDVLVKGKYLRHPYKDPMTKDGKWRIVRPGEVTPASGTGPGLGAGLGANPGSGLGASPGIGTGPRPSPSPSSAFGLSGMTNSVGVIAGVASTNKDTSLRMFNGRTKYDQWVFLPSPAPRQLGKSVGPGPINPGGTQPGGLQASPIQPLQMPGSR